MAKIRFENGTTVNFDGNPTAQDIDEAADNLGLKGSLTQGTANQQAGPVPSKAGMMNLLPTKEDLPELAGSVIGGIAGSPGGLPGMAVGSGIGSAIGEVARQGIFEKKPMTITERSKEAGGAALRGVAGEFGGAVIGKVAGKMFSPFSKSVTPEIKSQVQSAKALGVNPPISSMTESKPVQALERFAEYSPFGGFITRTRDKALKDFEMATERIGQMFGKEASPEFVSEMVSNKVKLHDKNFKAVKGKLYDAAEKLMKDQQPELNNTIQTLEDIVSKRSGVGEPAGLNELRRFLDDIKPKQYQRGFERPGLQYGNLEENVLKREIDPLSGQTIEFTRPENVRSVIGVRPGPIGDLKAAPDVLGSKFTSPGKITNFQKLKNFRSNIGNKIGEGFNDPGLTGIKSDLKRLYAAISTDLDASASNISPEFANAIKGADEVFSKGIRKLQSDMMGAIQKRAQSNPSNLYQLVIKPRSPEFVKVGRDILGQEGFDQVRIQWFDDVVKNSKSIVEGSEIVSPAKLANNLRKYGDVLDEVFKDRPELLEQVGQLTDTAKLLTRGNKVTQGSQTGFIMDTLKNVRGILASGLLATELGKEFLTTGFPRIGAAVGGTAKVATKLGTQSSLQK